MFDNNEYDYEFDDNTNIKEEEDDDNLNKEKKEDNYNEEEDKINIAQRAILNKLEEMKLEYKLEKEEEDNFNTTTYLNFALADDEEEYIDTTNITEESLQKMFKEFNDNLNQKNRSKELLEDGLIPENNDIIYEKTSKGGNITKENLLELQNEYNILIQNQKDLLNEKHKSIIDKEVGGLLNNIDFMVDDEYILSSDNTNIDDQTKQEIFNVDYWAESDEE